MEIRGRFVASGASLLLLLLAGNVSAQDSGAITPESGSGDLDVVPAERNAVDDTHEDLHEIQLKGEEGQAIRGIVRVDGIPVGRSGEVGDLEWTRSGESVTGTVTDPATGEVVATFEGALADGRVSGTFTSLDGQGSWAWERPLPQLAAAAVQPDAGSSDPPLPQWPADTERFRAELRESLPPQWSAEWKSPQAE